MFQTDRIRLTLILLLCFARAFAETGTFTPDSLRQALHENRLKVNEFAIIAKMAEERGLRAFLFGGTAAGYGKFVADQMRKPEAERTAFTSVNLYRSTQDLDLVVTRADGTPETPEEIGRFISDLHERFPHHVNENGAFLWDVRGLKAQYLTRQPLLSPEFLDQNLDSMSTTLIELTKTPPGEPSVRDVRDYDKPAKDFVEDLSRNQIRFYESARHTKTPSYKEGGNPQILSVLRVYVKAFRYGLTPDAESRTKMKRWIDAFDPASARGSKALYSIMKNARKMVLDAQNVEQALDELDATGLRSKLIAIENNAAVFGSLAWWLSKAPLSKDPKRASREIPWANKPTGKTAADLKLTVVTHATPLYEVFESIAASPDGTPNVFYSRKGVEGERAVHGDGFYTAEGEKGAWGYGDFHIRFKVDPDAREGVDFIRVPEHGFVVWANASKLHLIPESLHFDAKTAFEFLLKEGEWHDRALEGLKERLTRAALAQWNDEYQAEFERRANAFFDNYKSPPKEMKDPFHLPFEGAKRRWIDRLIAAHPEKAIDIALGLEGSGYYPYYSMKEAIIQRLQETWTPALSKLFVEHGKIRLRDAAPLDVDNLDKLPFQAEVDELLDYFAATRPKAALSTIHLAQPVYERPWQFAKRLAAALGRHWTEQTRLYFIRELRELYDKAGPEISPEVLFGLPLENEINQVLDEKIAKDPKAALELLLDKNLAFSAKEFRQRLGKRLQKQWSPELRHWYFEQARKMITDPTGYGMHIILSLPMTAEEPELYERAYRSLMSPKTRLRKITNTVREQAQLLFKGGTTHEVGPEYGFIAGISQAREWLKLPESKPLLAKIAAGPYGDQLVSDLFGEESVLHHLDLIEPLTDRGTISYTASRFFSKPHSAGQGALLSRLVRKVTDDRDYYDLATDVFSKPFQADKYDQLRWVIEHASEDRTLGVIAKEVLTEGPFRSHPNRGTLLTALQIRNPVERQSYLAEKLGPNPLDTAVLPPPPPLPCRSLWQRLFHLP